MSGRLKYLSLPLTVAATELGSGISYAQITTPHYPWQHDLRVGEAVPSTIFGATLPLFAACRRWLEPLSDSSTSLGQHEAAASRPAGLVSLRPSSNPLLSETLEPIRHDTAQCSLRGHPNSGSDRFCTYAQETGRSARRRNSQKQITMVSPANTSLFELSADFSFN